MPELGARIVGGLGVLLLSPTVLTAASRSEPTGDSHPTGGGSRPAGDPKPAGGGSRPAGDPRPEGSDPGPAAPKATGNVRMRIAVIASGLAAATSLAYTAPGMPWARADVLAAPAQTIAPAAGATPGPGVAALNHMNMSGMSGMSGMAGMDMGQAEQDTFSGVVKAGAKDGAYRGGEHADTSLDIVNDLASRMGLANIETLIGIFPEETGERIADHRFALCHIDVDVYQSGLDVLEWVWPRVPVGGVVVYDDYGFATCDGITRLVNERYVQRGAVTLHNLNGHAVVIKTNDNPKPLWKRLLGG